ncbi:MAG: pilus assembly protein TadG-related protein [Caulobacteraceae bacterium]
MRLRNLLGPLARGRGGSVAPMLALMLVPLIGCMGLAAELSSWFMMNRAMQNAADSAVVAAATNADGSLEPGSLTTDVYQGEAYAVASNYGFTNGANNVTVTATNTAACPDGSGNTCYQVTISRTVPLYLVGVVGFRGNATLNGAAAQTLAASSIARPNVTGTAYCLLALGSIGFTVNGGPKSDMAGCDVASNGQATCNGHNLNADAGYAVGTDTCGNAQHSGISPIPDPYSSLKNKIPANPCSPPGSSSAYPQEPSSSINHLSGTPTWSGTSTTLCGDVQMTGDVTLASGSVLTIENGQLDTNGHTFNGNGATVIFTGPTVSGLSPTHFVTGGGTLNLTAPTSGAWSGVALYQDPNLPSGSGVDISSAGNSPTWNVVGLVYAPNASVTISGAVGKNSSGACLALVVYTITINGTGYILDHNGCAAHGLTLPGTAAKRVALVQ